MYNSGGLPLYVCLDAFVYVFDGFGLPCGGIVSMGSRGCHIVVLLDGESAPHSSGLLFGMRYTLVGYMAPCFFLLSLSVGSSTFSETACATCCSPQLHTHGGSFAL